MASLDAPAVVTQLAQAGLSLFLAPNGGIAVSPSSRLTEDLRDLIRSSKSMLIDWMTAANDDASHMSDLLNGPADWRTLAAAYHSHHFSCVICIAAGRGSRYGQRCGVGRALWQSYCESSEAHS